MYIYNIYIHNMYVYMYIICVFCLKPIVFCFKPIIFCLKQKSMRKSTRNLRVLTIHRLGTYKSGTNIKYCSLGTNILFWSLQPRGNMKIRMNSKGTLCRPAGHKKYISLHILIFVGSLCLGLEFSDSEDFPKVNLSSKREMVGF